MKMKDANIFENTNNKPMIKGIVFDLDHTLFDRYETLRAVLPEMYKRLADKIPENVSLQDFIENFISLEKKHIYYGWSYTAERMVEEGIFLEGTKGDDVWKCLFAHCWPLAAVKFPFTEPTLIELRKMGLKLGILTNGTHEYQIRKLDMLQLNDFVDEIVISGDVGAQKPDAKPFIVMSERLGISPQNLMYVGDNPLNDIEGSRNAGYVPVWVKTIGNWHFEDIEHCEYEVDTVAELPKLVKEYNH